MKNKICRIDHRSMGFTGLHHIRVPGTPTASARPGSTTTRRWRPSLDRHVPEGEGRATRSKGHRQDKRKDGVSMHRGQRVARPWNGLYGEELPSTTTADALIYSWCNLVQKIL